MNETELLALVKAYKEAHDVSEAAYAGMANNPGDPDLMDAFSGASLAEFAAGQQLLKFIQKS